MSGQKSRRRRQVITCPGLSAAVSDDKVIKEKIIKRQKEEEFQVYAFRFRMTKGLEMQKKKLRKRVGADSQKLAV